MTDHPVGDLVLAYFGAFGVLAIIISMFTTGPGPTINTPIEMAGLTGLLIAVMFGGIEVSRRRA